MDRSDSKSCTSPWRWPARMLNRPWRTVLGCVLGLVATVFLVNLLTPNLSTSILNDDCNARGGGNTVTCSTTNNGSYSSQQALYTARLFKDYQSLDRGVLSYTKLGSLKTAATISFKVAVTDTGRGEQTAPLTHFNGMIIYPEDIPTGGIVGVQIVTCKNLTCQSLSDIRQPVLSKGMQAEWYWNITAGTPGPALITLRADTYDQGSTQALSSEIINLNVSVVPTPAFNNQQTHEKITSAARGITGDIETTGSIAGAVAAVGGIVGWIVMERRKRRDSSAASGNPSGGGRESADKSRRNPQQGRPRDAPSTHAVDSGDRLSEPIGDSQTKG
jgi:hypothetical protein